MNVTCWRAHRRYFVVRMTARKRWVTFALNGHRPVVCVGGVGSRRRIFPGVS